MVSDLLAYLHGKKLYRPVCLLLVRLPDALRVFKNSSRRCRNPIYGPDRS